MCTHGSALNLLLETSVVQKYSLTRLLCYKLVVIKFVRVETCNRFIKICCFCNDVVVVEVFLLYVGIIFEKQVFLYK
jgi:hypothetical protein